MRSLLGVALLAPALALSPVTATAQHSHGGLIDDLIADVSEVQEKLMGLAKAMPQDRWSWRPAAGVRSVGEVFQHVAADNYLLPAFAGTAPPAATGIVSSDYKTVQAYETRAAARDAVIADLEASFNHLKQAIRSAGDATLGQEATLFGSKMTRQKMWILTVTHLHEHLGQAIAYARSNGVTPPWSRGGM